MTFQHAGAWPRETEPVANQLAAICDGNWYYTTRPREDGGFYVSIYGVRRGAVVGLGHLLTDDQMTELGVEIERFNGKGVVFPKGGTRQYATVYALVVTALRLMGVQGDIYPINL